MDYPRNGYPRLAALMGKERNVAIFRRFDDLSILCLLSLQAEIVQLEKEFKIECSADDANGQYPASEYSSNFLLARKNSSEQHTKLKAIRDLIREYNELLMQVFELGQIDKPLKSQLKSLKGWLHDTAGGNSFLSGYETGTWEDDQARAYVCLEPLAAKGDVFTKWLLNTVVTIYDRVLGRYIRSGEIIDERTGDKSYSIVGVDRASNIITAILASALPVLAIYALNSIPSTNARIGVTAAFTVGFAILMGIFSSAKRSEMIAATATFAAIEVVFIGSALGGGSSADQTPSNNSTAGG